MIKYLSENMQMLVDQVGNFKKDWKQKCVRIYNWDCIIVMSQNKRVPAWVWPCFGPVTVLFFSIAFNWKAKFIFNK